MALFEKILIANRGEIACRVISTARRLGIAAVAVYSDADAHAKHVAEADEAVRIGAAPAAKSYLLGDRIIAAAQTTGAQAVHPGYGFLSENADFAEACAAAGLVFVGPPAKAIRAMGSKSAAKAIMEKAGVPLSPGYHGADQDPGLLAEEAAKIGYPVLIKASAGGGGKGMRLVSAADDFAEALASCKREATASFGDDHVLIERYIQRPRHIEIQVFCDAQGGGVHLFERDCSLQRRHQKVIEESPAPMMPEALRQSMGKAAVDAAQAVGYVGAGTVEFIVETEPDGAPGDFYFMEMNTRLQVEHPVTEMVTGLDLVEWQFRVAAGEPLPLAQTQIELNGHAFEARLYAEDPASDFLPATGALRYFETPEEDAHIRIDSGVRQGDVVTIHYDPMIAKIIAWDIDRTAALDRLRRALLATQVVGLATNRDFLINLTLDEDFAAGRVETGLIARRRDTLIPETEPVSQTILALAVLAEALTLAARAADGEASPWTRLPGWRLNDAGRLDLRFRDGETAIAAAAHYHAHGLEIETPQGAVLSYGDLGPDGLLLAELDGRRVKARIIAEGARRTVIVHQRSHLLILDDPMAQAGLEEAGAGKLTAPMPGKITALLVTEGETVAAGQALLVLEAMKMEHTIAATSDGTVGALRFAVGDQVEEGVELIKVEAE
ncbi:MAG: acetyl/propionyl/methylcrotonyl-CoA carboxylase subunit alpha [Alphaproteobacteria bacterium]|nr:acetyl/propionyl/methylcrotonyl-CoA carboxylase subunit alpha [Alphaproteobacteria bacterium]